MTDVDRIRELPADDSLALDLRLRPEPPDDELVHVDGQWHFRWRRRRFITSRGLADRPEELPA